jgi:hypothetical protein
VVLYTRFAGDAVWITGICDHCDDRFGPALIDKENGKYRKCWHEQEEISR